MTDELNDFGFCFIDEEEFEQPKAELAAVQESTNAKLMEASQEAERLSAYIKAQGLDALQSMQSLILPLLVNLKKNPSKDIIKWPNRGPIIQKQIDKLEKIVNDYQDRLF
jgi:hypothetical protein